MTMRDKDIMAVLLRALATLAAAMAVSIIFALLFSGCTRTVYTPSETRTETQYRYIERVDTVTVTVTVPRQSASQITADSTSHLETDLARSDAWLDTAGRLHHTLDNKPGGIPVQIPVKTIQRDSVTCKTRRVTYTIERNLTTGQKIMAFATGAATGITAAAVLMTIPIRRRRKQS